LLVEGPVTAPLDEQGAVRGRPVLEPCTGQECEVGVPAVQPRESVDECAGTTRQVHPEVAAAAGHESARQHPGDEAGVAVLDQFTGGSIGTLVSGWRERRLDAEDEAAAELSVQADAACEGGTAVPDATRVVDAPGAEIAAHPPRGPLFGRLGDGAELRCRGVAGTQDRDARHEYCWFLHCYFLCCE